MTKCASCKELLTLVFDTLYCADNQKKYPILKCKNCETVVLFLTTPEEIKEREGISKDIRRIADSSEAREMNAP